MLGAWVASLSINVVDALGARLLQPLQKRETVNACLNLSMGVPHGQIEHRLQLLRAEGNWVCLALQERTVVAVVSHVLVLLLEVEFVSHDLQGLGEILNAEGVHFGTLVLVDDREDHLAFLDFCDGLCVDDAKLLCCEHVGVLGQALELRQEEVEASILLGAIVNEGLKASGLLRGLLQFLNEGDLALHVGLNIAAVVLRKPISIGLNVILNLLRFICRIRPIGLQIEGHRLHLREGLLQQLEIDEGEEGTIGAEDGAKTH